MEEKKEIPQRREHKLDLRKFTKSEGFRALEEKLCSIGANDMVVTISSYDPDELKKEVDFIFYNIWDYTKKKLDDGNFEAQWKLKKTPENPEVDERINLIE